MARALGLSPMVPSFDSAATVAFFCDLLGFVVDLEDGGYAVLSRDGVSVHILPAGEGVGQMEMYLETDDVDGMWAAMEGRVADLRHKPPFDRPYGMREVHIEVPSTNCLLFIGQALG